MVLPSIYIIGNYFIEEFLKNQYEKELEEIENKVHELGDKYLKERNLNSILKTRLKNEKEKD